ncbi:hypothetical protein ACJX0J_022652, partial [Zea mays]
PHTKSPHKLKISLLNLFTRIHMIAHKKGQLVIIDHDLISVIIFLSGCYAIAAVFFHWEKTSLGLSYFYCISSLVLFSSMNGLASWEHNGFDYLNHSIMMLIAQLETFMLDTKGHIFIS